MPTYCPACGEEGLTKNGRMAACFNRACRVMHFETVEEFTIRREEQERR